MITIIALFIGAIIVVAGGIAELYHIVVYLVSGGSGMVGIGQYLSVNMTELIDLFLLPLSSSSSLLACTSCSSIPESAFPNG